MTAENITEYLITLELPTERGIIGEASIVESVADMPLGKGQPPDSGEM